MKNFAFILLRLLTTLQGCQKENIITSSEAPITNRTLGELTILGNKLTNPFTVANVRAAYAELYSDGEILNQRIPMLDFYPNRRWKLAF